MFFQKIEKVTYGLYLVLTPKYVKCMLLCLSNMFFYVPDMWEVESVKEIKDVMAG